MKLTSKIIGLTLLLLFLWLYNSYQQGDFDNEPTAPLQPQTPTRKESMAQMDARFPALPQSEYSDKQTQLEIDLEQYEQTVHSANDIIRERIRLQEYVLDDTQVQLRPMYDTPRYTEVANQEQLNPPPVPKMPNAMG